MPNYGSIPFLGLPGPPWARERRAAEMRDRSRGQRRRLWSHLIEILRASRWTRPDKLWPWRGNPGLEHRVAALPERVRHRAL